MIVLKMTNDVPIFLDKDDANSLQVELEKLKVKQLDEFICKESLGGMPLLMQWCIQRSSINCLDLLLKQGYKINCWDKLGNSPLHLAARKNNRKLVNFLLRSGALPDAVNWNRQVTWSLTSDIFIEAQLQLRSC
jgi:ankyrin repeat protein